MSESKKSGILLNIPPIIDTEHLIKFIKDDGVQFLWSPLNQKEKINVKAVRFDFTYCQELSPTGIIYLRMLRDHLNSQGLSTYYRAPKEKNANDMMKTMNLVIGEEYDKGNNKNKFSYPLHYCHNIRESEDAHAEIMQYFQKQFPDMEDSLWSGIDYMLTEIRDNAGVHGYQCYRDEEYPLPVYICGAEYNDKIEISIGDRGQGIWQSLSKNNSNYSTSSKKIAVQECLKDKVSGHPDSSPGFGLFSSKELFKNAGALHIWSSSCYLISEKGKEKIFSADFPIGTIVTFVIDKKALIPFDEFFEKYGFNKTVNNHMADFFVEV